MTGRSLPLGFALLLAGCPSSPPPPPEVAPRPIVTAAPPPPPTPTSPEALVAVASFGDHHCMLRRLGTVACWGKNTSGQLGNGAREPSAEPVAVQGIEDARAIGVGNDFGCALRTGGTVRCWGNNEDGQLGDGTGVKPAARGFVPVEVTGLRDVQQISVGEFHACALDRAGRVSCWGNGADGQLGRSVERALASAVVVEDLAPVAQIASGASHVCALLRTGAVRCWGRNTEGQLGAGVTGGRANPMRVVGLEDVTQIHSGHLHTCAVGRDGGVSCWGDNKGLQLGPAAGKESRSKTPVVVPGVSDVEQIAGGGRHTCARLRSKKLVCWGDGAKGQLGAATSQASAEPIEAPAGRGSIGVFLGGASTCALDSEGAARCWGVVATELGR